jgi:hypothetical protein
MMGPPCWAAASATTDASVAENSRKQGPVIRPLCISAQAVYYTCHYGRPDSLPAEQAGARGDGSVRGLPDR